MRWKLAMILFLLNIFDDSLAALYIRRVSSGEALQAGVISILLTVVIAYSVINYVKDWRYLIPIALGSGIGTYITVTLDLMR